MAKKSPQSKWSDEHYVSAYEFARSGMTDKEIARHLGVAHPTLRTWKQDNPALASAIQRGRDVGGLGRNVFSFLDYLLAHFSPKARQLWYEINRVEREENDVLKIEALLDKQGKAGRQHFFLLALLDGNWNLSRACARSGVSRKTYEKWVADDPDFAELVQEMHWHKKNFFEESLVRKVAEGDTAAILAVNRTLNRDRGYAERLDVQHTGQVDHRHAHIDITELGLPLDTERQVLRALRQRQAEVDAALPAPEQLP